MPEPSGQGPVALCPSGDRSQLVAKDKAAARPVDGECTYCCTLVVLDRADFDRTGSCASSERRHSALLTGLAPGPGLVPEPGPGLVPEPGLVLGLPELVAC